MFLQVSQWTKVSWQKGEGKRSSHQDVYIPDSLLGEEGHGDWIIQRSHHVAYGRTHRKPWDMQYKTWCYRKRWCRVKQNKKNIVFHVNNKSSCNEESTQVTIKLSRPGECDTSMTNEQATPTKETSPCDAPNKGRNMTNAMSVARQTTSRTVAPPCKRMKGETPFKRKEVNLHFAPTKTRWWDFDTEYNSSNASQDDEECSMVTNLIAKFTDVQDEVIVDNIYIEELC